MGNVVRPFLNLFSFMNIGKCRPWIVALQQYALQIMHGKFAKTCFDSKQELFV